MSDNISKEISATLGIKSLDEIMAEGNKSFDKEQNPALKEEAYRQAYLLGWLKSSYYSLYNKYISNHQP